MVWGRIPRADELRTKTKDSFREREGKRSVGVKWILNRAASSAVTTTGHLRKLFFKKGDGRKGKTN